MSWIWIALASVVSGGLGAMGLDVYKRQDLPTPEERFGREDMTRCFFYYMEHDELTGEDNCETCLLYTSPQVPNSRIVSHTVPPVRRFATIIRKYIK